MLKRWAGDLAAAAVLMVLLVAATPIGPVWLSLLVEDLAHERALHVLTLPLVGVFLVLWTLARGLRRLGEGPAAALVKRRALELVVDQNGALVLEFALIFPFIMALVFILFQWAELLMADGLVQYAAFAAARCAVTYANVAGGDPEQPNGDRFKIDQKRLDAMKHAANTALFGAYALEGGMTHDTVKVSLVQGSQQDVMKDDPKDGNGGYRLVHAKVEWGFIPRWPMSFLFFRPVLTNKRILIEGQYAMQVEGYYRSPSLNQNSQALGGQQDKYASGNQPPPQDSREGEIQKNLYDTVLKENHGAADAVSGTRDQLGANCN